MDVEARLKSMGLALPARMQLPLGAVLPFSWVRLRGRRGILSGHGPLAADGTLAEPLGQVGAEVSPEQGYHAAQLTGLAMLSSLKEVLVDLNRVTAWVRVFGMVNAAQDFRHYPQVINGFSDLVLALYGPERGNHARSAVGVAGLPWNIPVEIEAEVEID